MKKYNFDEIIDRSVTYDRKWNHEYLKEHFPNWNESFISSWIADTDFYCAPAVIAAMQKRLEQGIYGYSFVPDSYYRAIINYNHDMYHLPIEKSWIRCVYGTVSTLHYIVQAFTKKTDSVIIQTPVYGPFEEAIVQNQRKMVTNPLILRDDANGLYYDIDFADFEQKIKQHHPKIFILCNPHNPGGTVWTYTQLEKMLKICFDNNVLVVSDEVHRDMVFPDVPFVSALSIKNMSENLIMCTSLNKAFNFGGLKSSYIVVPNLELRKTLYRQFDANAITSPNVFVVPATIAAYDQSREWLAELRSYIYENFKYMKAFIKKNLPELSVMNSQASFLGWINFKKTNMNLAKFRQAMESKGKILLCYGDIFVEHGEDFIRLNFGCPRSDLEKQMCAIRDALCGGKESD